MTENILAASPNSTSRLGGRYLHHRPRKSARQVRPSGVDVVIVIRVHGCHRPTLASKEFSLLQGILDYPAGSIRFRLLANGAQSPLARILIQNSDQPSN